MKLTNNRFYFDYNATSPISNSVKSFLEKGGFDFLNPSSIHQSGQAAKKSVSEVRSYLYETFNLDASEFGLFFHSGATEGINTQLLGHAKYYFLKNTSLTFFYFLTDHPAVLSQVDFFKALGHVCIGLCPDKNGEFKWDELVDKISKVKGPCLLNFTYAHNLTGVVWDLDIANMLKNKTGISIHVDAVQSIGKIENFTKLDSSLDCYTFSGHKFGALKGIGFSFYKKTFSFEPLLYGGGQENGIRSGTGNVLGIYSLKLALSEISDRFNYSELLKAKFFLEYNLKKEFSKSLIIVAENAKLRNANTIFCLFKEMDTKLLFTAFDMAGIEVSLGPACSSGSTKASNALLAMGYKEDMASRGLRFSFSPFMTKKDAKIYFDQISNILKRFIS